MDCDRLKTYGMTIVNGVELVDRCAAANFIFRPEPTKDGNITDCYTDAWDDSASSALLLRQKQKRVRVCISWVTWNQEDQGVEGGNSAVQAGLGRTRPGKGRTRPGKRRTRPKKGADQAGKEGPGRERKTGAGNGGPGGERRTRPEKKADQAEKGPD